MWADALPNLLIGLREGLEAGLVVSILLAALRKHGKQVSSAPIWLGLTAAVILALSFGAVLTFYRSVLSTTGQEALGGSLSVVAVCLVTWMVFWMRRTARGLSGELRGKVDEALRVSTAALALTAFVAVGREGVETALFLWTAAQATGQTVAPIIGAAIGIACAVVLCVLLYYRAVKIRLDKFFNRTAILLIVIAGGVFAYGLGDLQDAGWLPGHLWVAFDLSAHIDASSWWMSIITGVTELSPTMTWLQVVAYVCYLGVVITLFVREGRAPKPAPATAPAAPAPTATAAAPAAETPAEPEPATRASRRRVAAGITAAMVVPPVAAGLLIAFAPGPSSSGGQQVEATATSCAKGWSSAHSGTQTYTVLNKTKNAVEINLIDTQSQGIVAEIETLGPGTQQTLSATLSSGSYAWRCLMSGAPTLTSATVSVSGSGTTAAPAAVKPVSVADLKPALTAYTSYVEGRLAILEGQVATVRGDLERNDVAAARTDWLPAQLTWDQVGEEPYGSFGDFGVAIDAGPQGFSGGVADPKWTGLHRLEYGLFHGQSAARLLPVAGGLASNVAALKAQLPKVNVDPTDLPIRAHEVLEDALRDQLSGQMDQGSGDTYAEVLAGVQVTRVVLGELTDLLNERAPSLLPTAYRELDTLQTALLATRQNGAWTSLSATPPAARQKVDAAIGAALQTLSDVPDLLETPAH